MCEARRAPSAARTSGHQRRTCAAISSPETPDEHENQDRGDERAGQQPEQGAHAAGGERQVERERRLGEDQEEGEEERLDDGARERVDRAGRDGGGRREALPLEEADVDGHPRQVGREGDVHVAHRQLHRVHRAQREPDGNRAQRRDRLRQPRQLCDHERHRRSRPRTRPPRWSGPLPVDPARGVDDRVRRQHEQRHLHRGPLGDPPELDRLGRLDSDGGRGLLSKLVDVEARRLQLPAQRGAERGRLQVRNELGDALGADRFDGDPQGPLVADEARGAHEQLRSVGRQLAVVRRQGRLTEIDEPGFAPDHDDGRRVDLLVSDL